MELLRNVLGKAKQNAGTKTYAALNILGSAAAAAAVLALGAGQVAPGVAAGALAIAAFVAYELL